MVASSITGNQTRARLEDEEPRVESSRHTADSGDSDYGSAEVSQSVDTPKTSPEPGALSCPDRVTDQLVRSSSGFENPVEKGSRSKPNSKSQGHGAPMWPYDHVAGCRKDRKGRRFLKVVWPPSEVPVEEVEGREEEWNKHRKMVRQEQRKQRRQDRLNRLSGHQRSRVGGHRFGL